MKTPLHRARYTFVGESAAALFALVVLFIVFSLLNHRFLSTINLDGLVVSGSIAAIAGLGMTLVIAMRGLDLSVGSVMGFSAIVVAKLLESGVDLGLALLAGLGAGCVLGLVNGLLIVVLRLPSFVATLATLSMILGAELLITSGETVTTSSKLYSDLVVKNLGGFLPAAALDALVIFVLVWILFHRMPFGRHVAAIGGNPKAATDAGINLRAVTVGVFVVSGICAAIAGMMVGAQLQTVDSTVGSGFELTAIAVVVVGGTSLTGGRGNLIGTVIAAFLLEVIHSALQILDVSSLYEDLAFGSILVGALMIDGLRRGASRKGMLVI